MRASIPGSLLAGASSFSIRSVAACPFHSFLSLTSTLSFKLSRFCSSLLSSVPATSNASPALILHARRTSDETCRRREARPLERKLDGSEVESSNGLRVKVRVLRVAGAGLPLDVGAMEQKEEQMEARTTGNFRYTAACCEIVRCRCINQFACYLFGYAAADTRCFSTFLSCVYR